MMVKLVLSICILLCIGSAFARPFIVENGRPNAEIVVASDAPRMTRLAAQELQGYIEKISGARLAITNAPSANTGARIYVGRSPYTDELHITDEGLKHGAFRAVSGPGYLVLLGHDADFVPPQPWLSGRVGREQVIPDWDKATGEKFGYPLSQLYKCQGHGFWDHDERGSLNAVYAFLRMQGVLVASAGYIEDRTAASQKMDAGEYEQSLAAFEAMAEGPWTEYQKSDALAQAALCAYRLKQYDRAMELARTIPLEPQSKLAQMGLLLNRNQWREVVTRFGGEDVDAWPDTLKGPASYSRGKAFQAAGNGESAARDLERAARYLLSDRRTRSKALTLLAATYTALLHDDQRALAAYQRLYDMGDANRQSTAVLGMAGILKGQRRYEEALAALQRVDLAQVRSPFLHGRTLETWGDVLAAAGRMDEAEGKYQSALQVEGVPDSIRVSCEKKMIR